MAKRSSVLEYLLTILSLLVLDFTSAGPGIDFTPTHNSLGLSDTLSINCTFSVPDNPTMAILISLLVSRANETAETYTELASISDFIDPNVNQLTTENVQVRGIFNRTGESYMNIEWESPTEMQSGVYQCSAHGLDRVGRIIVMTKVSQVTFKEPGFDALKDEVKSLKIYTQRLEETVGNLEQAVLTLGIQMKQSEVEKQSRISEMFNNFSLSYKGHKYYVSKYAFHDVDVSMAICKLYGGHLTEVNDVEEYQVLQTFLKSITGLSEAIISGTDESEERNWVLPSTGQAMPFTIWFPDKPGNDRRKNCMSLVHYNSKWLMNDFPCHLFSYLDSLNIAYRFMCEIPYM